jgi:hypothetical protein
MQSFRFESQIDRACSAFDCVQGKSESVDQFECDVDWCCLLPIGWFSKLCAGLLLVAMNSWQACRVMWLVVVVSGGLEAVTGIRCQSVLLVVGCGGVYILRCRFMLIRLAVARGGYISWLLEWLTGGWESISSLVVGVGWWDDWWASKQWPVGSMGVETSVGWWVEV